MEFNPKHPKIEYPLLSRNIREIFEMVNTSNINISEDYIKNIIYLI
jgi:hypothetical protein